MIGRAQERIQNPMPSLTSWYGVFPVAKNPAKQSKQRANQNQIRTLHILLILSPQLFRKVFLEESNKSKNH